MSEVEEAYQRMLKAKRRLQEFEERYEELLCNYENLKLDYIQANTEYIEKNLILESEQNDTVRAAGVATAGYETCGDLQHMDYPDSPKSYGILQRIGKYWCS